MIIECADFTWKKIILGFNLTYFIEEHDIQTVVSSHLCLPYWAYRSSRLVRQQSVERCKQSLSAMPINLHDLPER